MHLPVSPPTAAWAHAPILVDRSRPDGSELDEEQVREELTSRRLIAATFSGEDYGLPSQVGVVLATDGDGRVATEVPDGRILPAQGLVELLGGLAYRFNSRLVLDEQIEILPDGTEREFDGERTVFAANSRVIYAWPGEEVFDEHLVASAARATLHVWRTDGWTVAAQPLGVATRMPDPRVTGITSFPFVVVQRSGRLHLVEWVTGSKSRSCEGVAVHFPHVTPLPRRSPAGSDAHELAKSLARPAHLDSYYGPAYDADPSGEPDNADGETSRVRESLDAAALLPDGEQFLAAVLDSLGAPRLAALLALAPEDGEHQGATLVEPSRTPLRTAMASSFRHDVVTSFAAEGVVVDPSDAPLRTAAKQMFLTEIDTEPAGDSRRARLKRYFFLRPVLSALLGSSQLVLVVVVAVGPDLLDPPLGVPGWVRWPLAAIILASWGADMLLLARRARRRRTQTARR